MGNHKLYWTQQDIDEFVFYHTVASSSSDRKKLKAVVKGSKVTYRVIRRQIIVCDTDSFLEAVSEYNAI